MTSSIIKTSIGRRLDVDTQKEVTINSDEILKNNLMEKRVSTFKEYFETKAEEDLKPMVSTLKGRIDIKAGIEGNETKIMSTNVTVKETDGHVQDLNIDEAFANTLSRQLSEGYNKRRAEAEAQHGAFNQSISELQNTQVNTKNSMKQLSSTVSNIVSQGDQDKIARAKEILSKLREKLNTI